MLRLGGPRSATDGSPSRQSKSKRKMGRSDAESTASTELPAAGTYRNHPEQSTVCYRGRHMFRLGVVNATFRVDSGEILVADQTTSSPVTVSIDAE